MSTTRSSKTIKMVELALLIAIILLMAFTPIGYIRTGALSITLIVIPVAVGAVILGPAAGAALGAVFGITSFIQCFGMEPFGTALFSVGPVRTFIVCMVPRILMGLCAGLITRAFTKIQATKKIAVFIGSLSAAVLNTIFFMTTLIALFQGYLSENFGLQMSKVFAFVAAFVGINGVIEAIVACVVAGAVAKALQLALKNA